MTAEELARQGKRDKMARYHTPMQKVRFPNRTINYTSISSDKPVIVKNNYQSFTPGIPNSPQRSANIYGGMKYVTAHPAASDAPSGHDALYASLKHQLGPRQTKLANITPFKRRM